MTDYLRTQTQVQKVGEGSYEIETQDGWFGAVGLFGGYVNAIVLQALTAEVNDPERLPRSLVIHFLRPYPIGCLRVDATLERAGSSVSVLSFRAYSNDVLCGVGIGTFGKDRAAREYVHLEPPDAQPFDPEAKKLIETDSLACLANFDVWVQDRKVANTKSEAVAWVRSARGDVGDSLFCLAVSDAIPPVVFIRDGSENHFSGTMDFTAHFRRPELVLQPEEGILGHIYTAAAKSGYVDEDCALFTADGKLIYQSRQMRFLQRVDSEQARPFKLSP